MKISIISRNSLLFLMIFHENPKSSTFLGHPLPGYCHPTTHCTGHCNPHCNGHCSPTDTTRRVPRCTNPSTTSPCRTITPGTPPLPTARRSATPSTAAVCLRVFVSSPGCKNHRHIELQPDSFYEPLKITKKYVFSRFSVFESPLNPNRSMRVGVFDSIIGKTEIFSQKTENFSQNVALNHMQKCTFSQNR